MLLAGFAAKRGIKEVCVDGQEPAANQRVKDVDKTIPVRVGRRRHCKNHHVFPAKK
jgi:hypothetical protein